MSSALPSRRRFLPAVLFAMLLAALATGIWAGVLWPRAWELRGSVVARPAAGLLLIQHEATDVLGMRAMDLMAVSVDPVVADASGVRPGDRVRLAVRPRDRDLLATRIERLR